MKAALQPLLTGGKLPVGHYSPSQLALFMQCGMKYYWKYVHRPRLPELTNHHRARGIAFHRALADVNMRAKRDRLKQYMREEADKCDKASDRLLVMADAKVLTALRDEYACKYAPAHTDVLACENVVDTHVNLPAGGVPFRYVVDLLQRDMVTDFKVVGTPRPANRMDDVQFLSYAALERRKLVRVIQFIYKGRPRIVVSFKRFNLSSALRWLEFYVGQLHQAVQTGSYSCCDPASWSCSQKWCDYWSVCRGSATPPVVQLTVKGEDVDARYSNKLYRKRSPRRTVDNRRGAGK